MRKVIEKRLEPPKSHFFPLLVQRNRRDIFVLNEDGSIRIENREGRVLEISPPDGFIPPERAPGKDVTGEYFDNLIDFVFDLYDEASKTRGNG